MTLALFDFDGTLTHKDSFKTFLQSTCSVPIFLFKYYVLCCGVLLRYRLAKATTQDVKVRRVQVFLQNISAKERNTNYTNFSKNFLHKILKKDGLARICWHKAQGHRVVIVSASFDFLLENFCEHNQLEYITNSISIPSDAENDKLPAFIEPDCNYAEKVRRIKEYLDLNEYNDIYAYGDTAGDKPMLALANKPHFCFFD